MNPAIPFSIMFAMRSTGLTVRELKPDIIDRTVMHVRFWLMQRCCFFASFYSCGDLLSFYELNLS